MNKDYAIYAIIGVTLNKGGSTEKILGIRRLIGTYRKGKDKTRWLKNIKSNNIN